MATSPRDFSAHQLTLRVLIVVAPLVTVGAAYLAGARPHSAALSLVLLLIGYGAFVPDSNAALFLIALLAIGWFFYVRDPLTVWSIPGSLGILVLHSAAALATIAPSRADFEPELWRVWARRVLAVAVGTAVVWAGVIGFDRLDAPGSLVLSATGILLVAVLALVLRRGSVASS